MSNVITVTELVRHFADYVNRIAYRGERFQVSRGGRTVAEIGPVLTGRSLTELPDLLAGLPRLSDDDAAAVAADMES